MKMVAMVLVLLASASPAWAIEECWTTNGYSPSNYDATTSGVAQAIVDYMDPKGDGSEPAYLNQCVNCCSNGYAGNLRIACNTFCQWEDRERWRETEVLMYGEAMSDPDPSTQPSTQPAWPAETPVCRITPPDPSHWDGYDECIEYALSEWYMCHDCCSVLWGDGSSVCTALCGGFYESDASDCGGAHRL